MIRTVEVSEGDGPVIMGMPHTGTWLPADIMAWLNPRGQVLADTDWHVHRLYDGLLSGVTTVRALFHRYVIDANRGADDSNLYPGQNTTALVPLTDFDGLPIWLQPPSRADVRGRLKRFHAVYHNALAAQIARVRARHGVVVLYDCHSIRSHIPFLFKGRLPDLNIGTNSGLSCDLRIARAVEDICARTGRTMVVNGRFKGGWTTRHYGRPEAGVHAIQMELAQATYLTSEEPPFAYDAHKADGLRGMLRHILVTLTDLAPVLKG